MHAQKRAGTGRQEGTKFLFCYKRGRILAGFFLSHVGLGCASPAGNQSFGTRAGAWTWRWQVVRTCLTHEGDVSQRIMCSTLRGHMLLQTNFTLLLFTPPQKIRF